MDNGFPYIVYEKNKTPREWGRSHGEQFRPAIKELLEVRKDLMLARNPDLKKDLDVLAKIQWEKSRVFAADLVEELQGMAEGSGLSITDIVIVNNYTDFRDIEGHDQGCSTTYGKTSTDSFVGQTWDMHSSAKDYISMVHVPEQDGKPATVTFSLVGCVGMAGVNQHGGFIGVNNINTLGAKPGIIWPVLVRKVLQQKDFAGMYDVLAKVAPTSGHSYILGSSEQGGIWEVSPQLVECTGEVKDTGSIFHTNHCLGPKTKEIEFSSGINSTTQDRYGILDRRLAGVKNGKELEALLKDHENYPKSICSHFESGSQDPSMTCGGVVVDYTKKSAVFWRGCEVYDDNYSEKRFNLTEGQISS